MLLQLAVSLVILRLLTRDIMGFLVIPTAVVAVALVIVDSGFSQSLIRKAQPTPGDYKSVFLFNIVVSLLLYGLFLGLTPIASRFYEIPIWAQLAPVFLLQLPLNALCAVQSTIFIRQFRFALLSKVSFAASLVSGFAAIGLALAGFGVWSIVAQRVLQMAVRAVLLWWLSDWRPRGAYDGGTLREMAPYSCSLMATDLISTFYNKIPQFFLGKLYDTATLGSFDQAIKLKDDPTTKVVQSVQAVTFPALSKIRDDAPKFAESYRQVVMVVAYFMFPLMLGLSAVAHDMIAVLLGEEWMPMVPYFQVVSLAGLFYPVAMIALNVLKAQSDGKIIFRLEIFKKIVMSVIFAVTIPLGIEAVVWGLVLIAFCEMAVNFWATRRYTQLSWGRFGRTLLPIACVAVTMYIAVRLTALALPDHALLRLMTEVAVGVLSYLLLSALLRLEAFREMFAIIKKQVARK